MEVVPSTVDFWRRFRAQTSGQANAEGRRAGEEFRRGMQETAGRSTVRVRADVDTTRARAELASLERQGNQSGGGLLKALLPLAPALFPLAGAALAAGSGLAVLGGAGILAVTGLNRELKSSSKLGGEAAASVSVVKDAVHSLQSTAAKAALPGLQASVLAINTELPALRRTVSEQATIAGQVAAHLVRGIAGGFTTFRPIINAVGSDVEALAAHFDAFANGPGGAHFAKTLATDYAEVKPVIESVVRAVADIVRAGAGGGLSVLRILGSVANVIDSFPTPVLTTIIDGFLAFRAATLFAPNLRSFAGIKAAYGSLAAATQLASTQRIAADTAAAAVTAETAAASAEAMLATAEAARAELVAVASTRGSLSADQTAAMQVQLGIADREIASYEAVAAAARASAVQQAAAAEEAAGAAAATRSAAGAGAGLKGGLGAAAVFGRVLAPIALVATALPLLSGLFGDNGQAAQQAASAVEGYTSALVSSKGAIDGTVRSLAAKNLADAHVFDNLRKTGLTQAEVTDAVINGGSAMDLASGKVNAYAKSVGLADVEGKPLNQLLRDQRALFLKGAAAAADQTAAVDSVTAAQRAHARALHTDVASYQAATDAAAKSVDKTREQTVAMQLAGDAAGLLKQALDGLAGINLGTAQAQTALASANLQVRASFKQNGTAIKGNSAAAVANQQAIQSQVSAAQQYAEAIGRQTNSSDKAVGAFRRSKQALEAQLRAHKQLTPAMQAYIDKLYSLSKLKVKPTPIDADKRAASAKIAAVQAEINAIHQYQATHVDADTIAAQNALSRLQGEIDALHGKTVVISTITPDGKSVSVGNQGRGFGLADGGIVRGPGTGRSDTAGVYALSNGEAVIPAKAVASNMGVVRALIRAGRGLAGGGVVHSGKDWIYNGRYSTQRAADNAQASAAATATKQQTQATNQLPPDLRSLLGALSGTVAGVRSAIAAFVKDFKAAGASTRQVAKASHDEALLIANQRQLVTARTRLANVTQYGDTVRGALTGGFDPTKYGSVSDLIAGYQGQTGQNKDYKAEVDKLRGEARGNKAELSLINTLAASGQSTSLQSLAAGSAADLSNATKAYSGYNASVQGGVDAANVTKYGTTQAQASKDVQVMAERQDRLISVLAGMSASLARVAGGKSGAHVEQQLERLAHELGTLAQQGRRRHP